MSTECVIKKLKKGVIKVFKAKLSTDLCLFFKRMVGVYLA